MPRKRPPTGEYAVGYGRPPEHTRFKPGQSGNPRGRPKGRRDDATILQEILDEIVTINEGGRPRRISKRELLFAVHTNKALKGDARAFREVLACNLRFGLAPEASRAEEPPLTGEDLAIVARFLARESAREASEAGTATIDAEAEAEAAPARVSTATRENDDEAE